jgi:hypothetical protein
MRMAAAGRGMARAYVHLRRPGSTNHQPTTNQPLNRSRTCFCLGVTTCSCYETLLPASSLTKQGSAASNRTARKTYAPFEVGVAILKWAERQNNTLSFES